MIDKELYEDIEKGVSDFITNTIQKNLKKTLNSYRKQERARHESGKVGGFGEDKKFQCDPLLIARERFDQLKSLIDSVVQKTLSDIEENAFSKALVEFSGYKEITEDD